MLLLLMKYIAINCYCIYNSISFFLSANIRVFFETTNFLGEFLLCALMSHRFGFTSRWSVGPEDKSPFSRRFSIHR